MIPKYLYHIWVGPFDPPVSWMRTWNERHPGWTYKVIDNGDLASRPWRLKNHIDAFLSRGRYSGAADIIRYEILLETGGFLAPADAVSIKPVDDLFVKNSAYVVRENDIFCPESLSPILAAPAGHPMLEQALLRIGQLSPDKLGEPWVTTGNLLMGFLARWFPEQFTILSSRTFVPTHHSSLYYEKTDETYADHFFGSGLGAYKRSVNGVTEGPEIDEISRSNRKRQRHAMRNFDPKSVPWLNMDNWDVKKASYIDRV